MSDGANSISAQPIRYEDGKRVARIGMNINGESACWIDYDLTQLGELIAMLKEKERVILAAGA